MESNKQNTTKTASPAATIMSIPLLIYRQSNPKTTAKMRNFFGGLPEKLRGVHDLAQFDGGKRSCRASSG
jgi:hypothetical protein